MTAVTVNASKSYQIKIGRGLLSSLGEEVRKFEKTKKVCIVSDRTVNQLYGRQAAASLEKAGLLVCSFVFPPGEKNKNAETYLQLLNFLAQNRLTRTDMIVAMGGGVVGDLAGFAAATYLRGISFVQIPTTLLAAVDSSVGGKTAIDLPAGKNLAGAFYQPDLVLCDIGLLDSLPKETFLDGCAEVIKYGILYDPALFAYLEETGLAFDRETVIRCCVELKRDAVMADEFDTGERMKLNLGHTVGHGVEACSDFTVSHGQAVAIGTAIVTRASHCTDKRKILSLFEQFQLPTTTLFSAEKLLHYTLSDKKRSADTVKLIIPKSVGHCEIVPTPVDQLRDFIQAGL